MSAPPDWAVRTAADRAAIAAGYYWDQEAAERVVRFAAAFVAVKYAAGAGDQFRLFDWQARFLMSLYGWRRPDGGRRFRKVLLHVPKKNGKTLIVSVIALYELIGARVRAPLVASASTTKENAKQVYEQLISCINRDGPEGKLAQVCKPVDSRKVIKIPSRDGEYRALSADAPNAEGLNCSAVIVDEAHAHRSPKLYRTLEYAMIGRPDGFMVIISTAGDDLTHWYYALVERGRRILAGTDTDPTTYAEIYEANPDTDDLDDPATWRKVNPSIDQYEGFTSEAFRLEWEAAKKTTTDRLTFERYRFNIFRRAEEATWIDLVRWDACKGHVPTPAELRHLPVWLGFDASQRIDPTSISAVWGRPGRQFYARSWAFVAEAGVRSREKTNLPRYQQFIAEGSMIMTPGEVISKTAVMSQLFELIAFGNVQGLVMDPNGAWVIGQDLDSVLGIEKIHRQPQSHRWFNGPTRELETCVIQKRLTHDGSAWARWCVNSVRLDQDQYKNVRPVKKKSVDHIDGAVALLMPFALADAAAAAPPPKPSVYEGRGFRTL
ncbi:terminase large subunit [Gemmata sp. JC673]|uniref:Terminase large subunit n=1 Tax=Gemmata algarum TaxID=2975278 RepID=A0ABU5ES95_9BACT|nr:terminase TerL endonuclease subunit [Gemmata algarum]MDY3558114.1 terminase large subunit [Gemmata algarum]